MSKRHLTVLAALVFGMFGILFAVQRSTAHTDPAQRRVPRLQVGRYQMAVSSPAFGQGASSPAMAYVIDTATGQVWQENYGPQPNGQLKRVWESLGTPVAR